MQTSSHAAASGVQRSAAGLQFTRWACWLTCFLVMALLVTAPVSGQAQALLGLAVLTGLLILRRLRRSALNRNLFLVLGSVIVLRYLTWRLTDTLPQSSDIVGFGLGSILLAAELFCAFVLMVSLIVNAEPLDRLSLPRDDDADLPTVDVFIPCYNEGASILSMTVAAAKGMDYPAAKLKVWLLDDGGTDQKCTDPDPDISNAARARKVLLQELCHQFGARYLTRVWNEHAKAGNLNNGLAQSHAEIVVVFDADHAPFRQFLRETVGHFARDPKLFLVQTPHVFINPDPIERNLRTFDQMPSENEMFYAVTQRGLDKWNSSFFCGSAALMRRKALDSNGGFSGMTITEDCETAFELHAQGWTSLYVVTPLVAGLQPETFASFIRQRSRWCQGMLQILLLKNPLTHKGLKPIQRLAYLSSMTFWLFPLPRLIFMFAPLLYIFFDVKIFVANFDETLAYTLSYVAVTMLMQSYLYGHVRWPWMSELYEYVQGVFLVKAIASVIASPRTPTFSVTEKGISLDHEHLSELAWPFFALFGLLAAGATTAVWRYLFDSSVTELMLVVGSWATINLVIAGVALGVVAERRQLHRHPRLTIHRKGVLSIQGLAIPVEITDTSSVGCGITMASVPAGLDVRSAEMRGTLLVSPVEGCTASAPIAVTMSHATQLTSTRHCGLAFSAGHVERYMSIADLMYGDAGAIDRFLKSRRNRVGIARSALRFVRWGMTEPLRAIAYALHDKKTNALVPLRAPTPAVGAVVAFDPDAFTKVVHRLAGGIARQDGIAASSGGTAALAQATATVGD